MNLQKLIKLIPLVCGLVSFLPALHAQGWKLMTREEIEAKVHPALMQESNRILHFDTCRLSVGTMREDDPPRTVSFRFRNISQDTLSLTRISTSCGCTEAIFSRKPLAPQEESRINLTFHPKNRPGTVDAEAWIYTQLSDRAPIARLSLTGYVSTDDEWSHLPQNMGHLRLTRKEVTFLLSEHTGIQRIACANSGEQPLRLTALLLPTGLSFHTEPTVIQPGQEGDLVISLDTEKISPMNTEEKTLSVILDGISGKPSERTIKVLIKR
ncbi:secreted protein containing DUF1573 [gut metagenome]|uniref:Secreted protein containing DUF1573 n=1 Tax=gut metagenome TaxID=749906 RepID=J9GRV9_9ZZZZ